MTSDDDPELVADQVARALDEHRDLYWSGALELLADMFDTESDAPVSRLSLVDSSKGPTIARLLRNAAGHVRRRKKT